MPITQHSFEGDPSDDARVTSPPPLPWSSISEVRLTPDGTCTWGGLTIHVEPGDLVEYGTDANDLRYLRIKPTKENHDDPAS